MSHHSPVHFPLITRDLPQGESSAVTGVIQGGVLSSPSTTTFSISDGEGLIVDQYTFPSCPTRHVVTWKGLTGITDLFPSNDITYVYIDDNGQAGQFVSQPTGADFRTKIIVGALAKQAGAIYNVGPLVMPSYEHGNLARDISVALGPIVSGGVYTGNAGALTLARSGAEFLRIGVKYATNKQVPNISSFAAQSPAQLVLVSRNNSNTSFTFSSIVTTFNPAVYDNGGASTAGVPTGTVTPNRWQAVRLYLSGVGLTAFQWGTATYTSVTLAQQGVGSEAFFTPSSSQFLSFRGYLFVRGGATDLSLVTDAVFQPAGKLGEVSPASSSGSPTGGLLTTYTVATLPAAPLQGSTAAVSDATAPTYLGTLTGGGTVFTPVVYNGTAWVSY